MLGVSGPTNRASLDRGATADVLEEDDESGAVEEVFAQARNAGPVWVESESLRISVAGYDGHVFGSGWSRDEPAHQI